MQISIYNRSTGKRINSFDSSNPLVLGLYARINHDRLICKDIEGKEYAPYKCFICGFEYGGWIFNPCPQCGENG